MASSSAMAYKAKLKEGFAKTTTENRRTVRTTQRKESRDEVINKRRNIPRVMSPVFERELPASKSQSTKRKNEKPEDLLDRLKHWREQKKRDVENEKRAAKAKNTFKVSSALSRNEGFLYAGSSDKTRTAETKNAVTKKVIKKPVPQTKTKNLPVATKASTTTNVAKTTTTTKKAADKSSKPHKPEQLAFKLTAAAAAKRIASPKKFLRATRASTLRQKDTAPTKTASKVASNAKTVKGQSSRSNDIVVPEANTENNDNEDYVMTDNVAVLTEVTEDVKDPSFEFKPMEVPKILVDFNFSAMATDGTLNDSSTSNGRFSFAGLALDSRRKSTRKSTRFTEIIEEEEPSDLIQFTPAVSKRKSMRKSVRLTPFIGQTEESDTISEQAIDSKDTPKSNKRKSMRKSKRQSTSQTSELINENPLEQADDLAFTKTKTPRSSKKRKSTRKSLVDESATRRQLTDLQIDDGCVLVLPTGDANLHQNQKDMMPNTNTPNSMKRKRKSARKSLRLVDIVSEDKISPMLNLNDGVEQPMEQDPAQLFSDSKSPLVGGAISSTPIQLTKAQKVRSSILTSATVSSIDAASPNDSLVLTPTSRRSRSTRKSSVMRRTSRKSLATPLRQLVQENELSSNLNTSTASPNSQSFIENIPRGSASRRSVRKSTVVDVSDEGTAVGRRLEPAFAYTVEKTLSANASRILKELVIEKVDGEKSFFEVSFDESMNKSVNKSLNKSVNKSINNRSIPVSECKSGEKNQSTMPFTPRKSNELTVSGSSSNNCLFTPESALRTRHSMLPSSSFKEPGLPLSAIRKAGSSRRKTACATSKTPEQMIEILSKSPMVEMNRRKSKHLSPPEVVQSKGQEFYDLINNETDRLRVLCNEWNEIAASNESHLSEEILGQIRSTVGKALLLMEQRFKQFSGLIRNYVYDLGEKETTPSDLRGFWEMIYFQVEDVNAMFKDLDELQKANWQVKVPTPKAIITKKRTTKDKAKTKNVKSNFAAFKAQMMKKKACPSQEIEIV